MRKNEQLEVVLRELALAGIRPEVERTKKHIRVRWSVGGAQRQYVVACTSKSSTGKLNARTNVRRMLREDALLPPSF